MNNILTRIYVPYLIKLNGRLIMYDHSGVLAVGGGVYPNIRHIGPSNQFTDLAYSVYPVKLLEIRRYTRVYP